MNAMISCKNCAAMNSLDSAFCKKCGATVPDDELQVAKQKLEAAVADGYKIFNSGRTDEAMHIAESAVQANPTSTAALSLKAMCHERMGEISEALECHERVLDIDPDSMIDRIKANDLRNLLVARSSIAAVPDRKMAIASAVAAFVLVASIGVVIAKSVNRDDTVASKSPTLSSPQSQISNQKFEGPAGPPGAAQADPHSQTNTNTNTATGQNSGTQAPAGGNGAANQTPQDGTTRVASNKYNDVQLPDPTKRLPGVGDGNTPFPVNIEGPIGKPNTAARTNPTSNPGTNPPVPAGNKQESEQGDPPPVLDDHQAKQEAPGIMEIKVVSGGNKSGGDNNDPSTHPNGVEALLRTARNQYQIGNYTAAANSYERALRAGADPASANQRLAQCYEKLGRNSDAIAAYGRAISALQGDLDSGRGDKDRLSSAIDSCRQALKVLGG